ncbi:cytochrome P450 [Nocardia bhagyanarayanae]|uniref:cytochrome P450 n=1 Tax=Nocardia bhagyanarayanae TaxID=1215925 RepID=UPI001FE434F4|nr:cytochrome P450 [Nocardia bhagyanarayanae]
MAARRVPPCVDSSTGDLSQNPTPESIRRSRVQPQQAPLREGAEPRPIELIGPRISLYSPEFAHDPHRAYEEMRRRYGPLVPVEIDPGIPATLVIGYSTAVKILGDETRFPADPRAWQKTIDPDSPILPMVEWRPNALRNVGATRIRYRTATNDALAGVDLHSLHAVVERIAVQLINSFCRAGEADLISQYVQPLVFSVLNHILGCPPEIGERVAAASAAMFEGVDTATVNAMLDDALLELVDLKRAHPAEDVATRLVQHPADLDDKELINALVTCYAAGIEPQQNLISNTLRLMLTDRRWETDNLGSAPLTRAALEEILATDPPLANYCITYPPNPVMIAGASLPANEPVIISMAACSNDPAMNNGQYFGHGAAWSLGWGGPSPHQCPRQAQASAFQIAQDAIDQLLDALPELRLAIPADDLVWRPGPFHRALAALPVAFPKMPPLNVG